MEGRAMTYVHWCVIAFFVLVALSIDEKRRMEGANAKWRRKQ